MRIGIIGHFEQRQENVVDNFLELRHKFVQFKDIAIQYKMRAMRNPLNLNAERRQTIWQTYYNLGICMSQRTLSEETSLWIAHLASLSHSSGLLP